MKTNIIQFSVVSGDNNFPNYSGKKLNSPALLKLPALKAWP